MVTGLYASLAASASVFIGILTAILASKVSNLKSERNQIEHRTETIDARLESLDEQKEELEEHIEEILELWEHEDELEYARKQVNEFIEKYVGDEFTANPESLTLEDIAEAYADFADKPEIDIKTDEYVLDELEKRSDDIKQELGGRKSPMTAEADMVPDADSAATHRQTEAQQRIHQREEYNRYQHRWHQTKTELQSLQTERDRLESRYSSLDSSPIVSTLWIGVGTIILSVVSPSVAYLLREIGFTLIKLQSWVEPTLIFSLWVIGLTLIFYHLYAELDERPDKLPNDPDVDVDGLDIHDVQSV
jgi:predicted  nucleic acid-binding Zn-ribbon protein